MSSDKIVLVTGGSGFIGSHVVHRLLKQGYTVRTTVRSLSKSDQVRKQVLPDDPTASDRLSFYAADLMKDEGWTEAVKGCDYVLHVASPFPLSSPKDENELIRPAVDGTLRVLNAAAEANVKRVVVTSSFAAIGYGHTNRDVTLDETMWTDVNGEGVGAYVKSKTLAEKAAWDFIAKHPSLELSVVNPVAVFGPLLPGTSTVGSSVSIVQQIVSGKLPAAPKITIGAVDVRDVADMHIIAMTKPEAAGKRFLATTGDGEFTTLQDIGAALGKTVRTLPDWLVRGLSYVVSDLAAVAPELGKTKRSSNKQAREVLGIKFISMEEMVKASADSLRAEGKL